MTFDVYTSIICSCCRNSYFVPFTSSSVPLLDIGSRNYPHRAHSIVLLETG
ncbi:hypothetical protein Cassandra_0320 [Pseudomonas phage Cassandra]|nr:hypothetical protein Cassandra_0320 [Pseudomonas phage Cassandra]WPK39516.1 hypothetical protein Deiofobo_0319 [Pseudomonas phage Deifobo]